MQSFLWFLSASLLLAGAARLKMRCADIEAPLAGEAPMWVFVTSRWSQGTTKRSRHYKALMRIATFGSYYAALQAWLLACEVL